MLEEAHKEALKNYVINMILTMSAYEKKRDQNFMNVLSKLNTILVQVDQIYNYLLFDILLIFRSLNLNGRRHGPPLLPKFVQQATITKMFVKII